MDRIGIGVITYNRPLLAQRCVNLIAQRTASAFEIVVADDGSPEEVVSSTRQKVPVISGKNKGVAHNKNRAIFHLAVVKRCTTIILLEDDTHPLIYGWERPIIEACKRWGHVNYVGIWSDRAFRGAGTLDDPFHSAYVSGQCTAFSAEAIAYVGYLDPRFGRFGWEHYEHTCRLIRAGYGGYVSGDRMISLQINASLDMVTSESHARREDIESNRAVFEALKDDPIYRSPWTDDDSMRTFQLEQKGVGLVIPGWSSEPPLEP